MSILLPKKSSCTNSNRPPCEEYFIDIAWTVAKRSTCLRRQVGAILVKDRHILTTGYNGPPSRFSHCDEKKRCPREEINALSGTNHEQCWGVHAEQNAIIQAAYHGIAIHGSMLYCTHQPCSICAKMIINAGIIEVYYTEEYPDPITSELFHCTGVNMIQLAHQVS